MFLPKIRVLDVSSRVSALYISEYKSEMREFGGLFFWKLDLLGCACLFSSSIRARMSPYCPVSPQLPDLY